MTKLVSVIASGDTERRALPLLASRLKNDGIELEVIIPPNNRKLTVSMAESLVKSLIYGGQPPDKVVVLIDVDGKDPEQELRPFREELPERLRNNPVGSVLFAYARWHLEAWYFGDAEGLRRYLGGRGLGNVDASHPDSIENPKLHLQNLLGRQPYTAVVSADIAAALDPATIERRSPSFKGFLEAVQNGA